MEIQHKESDGKGMFFIGNDGEVRAKMTYVWSGEDRIIIDHTEVNDKLRGTGAGKKMVLAAVDFAREKKISIIPLCPFAKSVFERQAELRDVL
ncbi:MAG: GNAT family N-acetyltransferase [Crocinitomicaceae bacterium]